MRILSDNHVFDETVTASTTNANFPLTNITSSRRLSDVFKMTSNSGTITVSGTSLTADYAVIIGTNATSADLDGTSFTLTGGVDVIYFTSATRNSWVFSFSGTENIEVAGLWLGQLTQMPPMQPNQTLFLRDDDTIDESNSGQIYIFERPQKRLKEYAIQYPFLTTTQKQTVESFWQNVGHQQIVIDVWESSHDIQAPLYVYEISSPIQISRTGDRDRPWSVNLTFRETN